ncbi:MAG TPA: hypothetical protein VH912_25370 [Streptosporangiaceae bacterium]
MAHGQERARTVLASLRSMMSRVLCRPAVRRLLIVAGIVLAGWLVGSAGQAHADTAPGPQTGLTHAVLDTTPVEAVPVRAVLDRVTPDRALPDGVQPSAVKSHERPYETEAASVSKPRGIVRGVLTSVRRYATHCLPGRVVIGILPTTGGGSGMDVSQAPRHRADAVAGPGERTTSGDAMFAGRSAAKDARGGHTQFRTGAADPASPFGSPFRTAFETGALPTAGSAPTGGAVGHPARLGAVARPSTLLASLVGAIPPAVHTATDEPALSPD